MHFQLEAITPKGSSKGMGKAAGWATMPTSVTYRWLLLDRDFVPGFISENLSRHIWLGKICCFITERVWDLFHDIIFLNPVMARHISQFQLMWPHRSSWSSHFRQCWAALCSYMGQMFNQT
jgi:hypothetical protein